MDVNIFNMSMRGEFNTAYAKLESGPAPWEAFTSVLDSQSRIENYNFMGPAPGMAEYVGHRRLATLGNIKYTVTNKEFDGSFSVLLRDIQDDIGIAGYKTKPGELANNAKAFPGRLALTQLANGSTYTGFDGTAFFNSSHAIGTGNNAMTYDAASNDGVTHKAILLYTGGDLKPLIYQNRKAAEFNDDYGEKSSKFLKQVNYWADMEGAAAFGYWWDAVQMTITDTPTLTECQDILRKMIDRFRTFYKPKALPEDQTDYVHELTQFGTNNATLVVSGQLGELFRMVLSQPLIVNSGAAVSNIYNASANLVVSNYLN